ncbi:MAG: cytochrome c [Pseudolabrys sp.]
MIKLISLAVIAGVLATAVAAHEGHDHATGVVKERMITMTSMGQRLLAISKRLRANKDLAQIAGDAHVIHELAGKLPKQFPPGSTQFPTAAKPAVWTDWTTFESHVKKLEIEADKLMNVKASNGDALRAQFRALAQACDGCHESFRTTKD